jgi:hypothetical protein
MERDPEGGKDFKIPVIVQQILKVALSFEYFSSPVRERGNRVRKD